MQIDGDPHLDHILQLIDYVSNPAIESKNNIVINDITPTIEKMSHSMNLFKICLKKVRLLSKEVYKPQFVSD